MRLLIQLKREGRLTWQENYYRRFTEKFPRRSLGSLQVRYHTEVKEKATGWADGGCFGHAGADLSLGNVTFAIAPALLPFWFCYIPFHDSMDKHGYSIHEDPVSPTVRDIAGIY